MAIAIAQELAKDGGTAQVSVTSASFTPATGTLIVVLASCYAASGDDTSTITITDSLGLTWTKRRERSQNDDGAGINPPPVVGWTATGTGSAMTVTTTRSVGSTGFSHVQAIWVLTGASTATPVDASAEASITGTAATLNVSTTVDGCLLLFISADWGSLTTPAADGNTTLVYAIANADVQGTFVGRRAVTTAGSYAIGTATPSSGTTVNAIALAINPGTTTVTGTALAALGALTATVTGTRKVYGTAVANLGGLTGTVTGLRKVGGVCTASLGTLTATVTGSRKVFGTSSASLGFSAAAIVAASAQATSGGFYGLLAILQEARADIAAQRAAPPVACPNDGEPLKAGLGGVLHCAYDGWRSDQGGW